MAVTPESAQGRGDGGWDPSVFADTPLGHELAILCRRLLGPGPQAARARERALATPFSGRLTAVERALVAAHALAAEPSAATDAQTPPATPPPGASLREVTDRELARANAALTFAQRELLALTGLLRLSHTQIAALAATPVEDVAAGLGGARLALREALRGPWWPAEPAACAVERRAHAILARRGDGETVRETDTDWLFEHLGTCPRCVAAQGAMLEAMLRYRLWGRP